MKAALIIVLPLVEQSEQTHPMKATHFWDSEMLDKHRRQPTGRTGDQLPER